MALAICACVVLAVAVRALLFDLWNINHADELTQYLEQANRLLTGTGVVPWDVRDGIRNPLVPLLLAPGLALGKALSPDSLLGVVLARGSYAALCGTATLAAGWAIGAVRSPRHAVVTLFVAASWFMAALMGTHLLSESLAAPLLACGAALLVDERSCARRCALAGFLLGLGVLLRLQYAPFALVAAGLALGRDGGPWRMVLCGGLAALALGALADLATGAAPLAWTWRYVEMTVIKGRAAEFGRAGPWEYAVMVPAWFGPFAAAILLAAVLSGTRYRPLLIAALVNLVLHSLIEQKVYRFVWVSVLVILLLAASATLEAIDRLIARARQPGQPGTAPWWGIGAACALWALASWAGQVATGGAGSFRWGGETVRAARFASAQGETCGMIVPFHLRPYVVPVMLRRQVPIFIMYDNAPLSANERVAANVVIGDRPPMAGAQGYAPMGCFSDDGYRTCAWRRPGPCVPAANAAGRYQQFLLDHDL